MTVVGNLDGRRGTSPRPTGQEDRAPTTSRPRALVALNPAARHGTGARRWERVRGAVAERFDAEVARLEAPDDLAAQVACALDAGVRAFVAAGGDGTVHALVNALGRQRFRVPLGELTLAAVGLGSSNDFHKPYGAPLHGVPVRLGAPAPRDVARARFVDEAGAERERLFLVSASLGATAAANALFNRGDPVLRRLKPRWTGGAIAYTALRAIAAHRGLALALAADGVAWRGGAANLSVLKTPFLSGSLAYDTPVAPASGLLAVNLCEERGRPALLGTLAGLARGRFVGRPGARHWALPALEVTLEAPADLELDGELVRARRVRFDVLPERIGVCG